jgi:hypothetical protein
MNQDPGTAPTADGALPVPALLADLAAMHEIIERLQQSRTWSLPDADLRSAVTSTGRLLRLSFDQAAG